MRNEEPINAAQSLLKRIRPLKVDLEGGQTFWQSSGAGLTRERDEIDRVSGEQGGQCGADASRCARDGDSRFFDIGLRVVEHAGNAWVYHGTMGPTILDRSFLLVNEYLNEWKAA